MFNMWGDEAEPKALNSADASLTRTELNKKYPKPLVAIDRDGVICEGGVNPIKSSHDFIPIEGSLEAIAMIRSKGYKLAIIMDQPWIVNGGLSTNDVEEVNNHMIELFGKAGCPSIDCMLYNTSNLKDDVFAKPNTGMFKRLREEFEVPTKAGYYVGDRLEDIKMADRAKLRPILVRTGQHEQDQRHINSFANRPLMKKTKTFNNLLAFAQSLP